MSKQIVSVTVTDRDEIAAEKTVYATEDAHEGVEYERKMTLLEGIRQYPKAVFWSAALSCSLIMEGYDTLLLGNLYALPAFQRKYGSPIPGKPGSFAVSATWQAGLGNASTVGDIIGLFLAGYLADRFGYRKTLAGFLVLIIGFIFIVFFSPSLPVLLVGELLCGICWGSFQTLTTTYAAEICPVVLRGYLTTFINMCWQFGHLIGSGILRGMSGLPATDERSFHIPWAIQWIWPVPIIVAIYFAPESPWWLVRKGMTKDAEHAVRRLHSNPDEEYVHRTVAMMVHTNDIEQAIQAGTSYKELFMGTSLRRTELACGAYLCQALCGSSLETYSTTFYEQAGLRKSASFDMTCVQYSAGILGTLSTWIFLGYFGRRSLFLFGGVSIFLVQLIIGLLSLGPKSNPGFSWAIGTMFIILELAVSLSFGPGAYAIVPELPTTRLRQKTVAVARNCYNIMGIVTGQLNPRMLNPTAWNWGAKAGFFYAGLNALLFVWIYLRLPETKGRSFAELDLLFERKVSARQFKTTHVEPFVDGDD